MYCTIQRCTQINSYFICVCPYAYWEMGAKLNVTPCLSSLPLGTNGSMHSLPLFISSVWWELFVCLSLEWNAIKFVFGLCKKMSTHASSDGSKGAPKKYTFSQSNIFHFHSIFFGKIGQNNKLVSPPLIFKCLTDCNVFQKFIMFCSFFSFQVSCSFLFNEDVVNKRLVTYNKQLRYV